MKCFSMIVLSGVLALPAGAMLTASPGQEHIVASDEVQVAEGQIKSVDAERKTFVLSVGEDSREITLRVNERTQFTLDGKESTMEEALKDGHDANVSHRNNVAIRVDATSKSPEHQFAMDDEVQTANGSIKSVDSERKRFVLAAGDGGEEMTIHVNERTQFTLDGKESTMEEALKEGHDANVSHRNKLAMRVDATTQAE